MNKIYDNDMIEDAASNKTANVSFSTRCKAILSKKKKNRVAISEAASYVTAMNMHHKKFVRENECVIVASNYFGSTVKYTPESMIVQRYHKGRYFVDQDPITDFNQYVGNGVLTSYSVTIERMLMSSSPSGWQLQAAFYDDERTNDVFIHFIKTP
jgi:hypothetical protein